MKTKTLIQTWLLALSISLIAAPAWSATITVSPSGGDYTTIQDAVTAANPGDTITVAAGTYALTSPLALNKANLTIQGDPSRGALVTATGALGASVFNISASGVTIEGLRIQKTDKPGPQSLILIGAANTTVRDCEISGQFVLGDGDVSRGFEVAYGTAGLTIEGNSIHGLRQPGYFNGSLAAPTTGTISNNSVYGTKGWVIAGANMTFTGNTWGVGANANYLDIAILSGTPAAYFTDLPAIGAANNGAAIEDQRPASPLLSMVYVNAAAVAGGNGTVTAPYRTIAEGVSRVMTTGTVNVAAGGYTDALAISKPLTLLGPQANVQPVAGGRAGGEAVLTLTNVDHPLQIVSDNVTVNGFEITGFFYGPEIQLAATANAQRSNVAITHNYVHSDRCWTGFVVGESVGSGNKNASGNCIVSDVTISDNIIDINTNNRPGYTYNRAFSFTTGFPRLYGTNSITYRNVTIDGNSVTFSGPNGPNTASETAVFAGGGTNNAEAEFRFENFRLTNNQFANFRTVMNAMNVFGGEISGNTIQNVRGGFYVNLVGTAEDPVVFANNVFENVQTGYALDLAGDAYAPQGDAYVEITGNTFNYNQVAYSSLYPAVWLDPNVNAPTIVMTRNGFLMGGANLAPAPALQNDSGTGTVSAAYNYWGSANPDFDAVVAGPATYMPYYTDAVMTQLFYPVRNITRNTGSMTIQPEIDAALAGDVIKISGGTYNGAITVNKDIDLVGAGSGSTVISSSGTVVAIPSAGSGASISGIRATGGARGFNLNGVSNVLLDGVSSDGNTSFGLNFDGSSSNITLRNSSFSNNTSSGIKVSSTSRVSGLLVDACAVNGNINGFYAADGNAAFYQAGAQLQGLTINHGSSFSNNTGKGIYIESMNNGLFDGISVVDSGIGITGGTAGGIDINLKYANYSNLTIRNSFVSGCGRNYSFGGGIIVKARNDGSYASNPATLGGTVLLEGLRVENNGGLPYGAGIRVGDSITNTTPANVQIHGSAFTGNSKYAVLNVLASGTVDATGNYWASPTGPIGLVTNGVAGVVNYSPWYNVSDASTPPVLSDIRSGIISDLEVTTPQTYGDLYVAPGTTVTVTPEGSLAADKVELADGAEITVNGGELDLGQGSVICGTFTIFNSFGSWDINGDTTFNIGQSLALISDIHVAAGKTVNVRGGGELILDGCIIDSQTQGTPYNFTAETDGLLTLARCVVTDANIDINTTLAGNLRSRVYDSSFITSDIEASSAAKVYHNLLDAATDAAKNTDATTAFDAIDGWANVTDAGALQNKFTLDFEAPVAVGRTLDAAGNLFVQPADAVVVKMDVAALGSNTITAAEALLGYNSGMLTLAGTPTRVTPLGAWEVIAETAPAPSGLGIVDSALGLQLNAGEEGISADSQIAKVNFTAGSPGLTLGFFRVQTDGLFNPDGTLVKDTRLTKSTAGMPSLLEAFTANTGELIIDNELPAIATTGQTGTQVQPTNGTVDVLNPANYVIRNGTPVMLSFTATDAGLAGLDAPDATADLVLTAYNGTTTLGTADYTVTAMEAAGVVTYTVTLNVPSTASTGTYAVTATVRDRSGNVSPLTTLGSFQIANEVLATVELEAYAGGNRDVVFTATNSAGIVLTSWTKNVVFTGTTGTVPLEAVPAGTAAISAKTAWNLRSKLPAVFSPVGVSAVSLTGTDKLPGGDLTGDNVVNTLDYSALRYHWLTDHPVADINGDAVVNLADYGLLKGNFYTIGDPQ